MDITYIDPWLNMKKNTIDIDFLFETNIEMAYIDPRL